MIQHEDREKMSEKTLDLDRARRSLIEEIEAVNWYQERIDATKDDSLKDILVHNRDEEKEHAAMIIEWIRREDPAFHEELETYLFKDKKITEIEEE
ncbi:MAG: ferritin [Candidatus Thermoplasmatota archaeon]